MGFCDHGVLMKISTVIGILVVLSAGCYADDADQFPRTRKACSRGWVLCPTSKSHCIPKECAEADGMDEMSRLCTGGQVYCQAYGGVCVKPCHPVSPLENPSAPMQPTHCPPGKMFCMRIGKCSSLSECVKGNMRSRPPCAHGFTFCIAQGGCVLGGCRGGRRDAPRRECPPGKVSCSVAILPLVDNLVRVGSW
ncbi:uncharacterized protein [Panulirus ornatus]|uniref:uncharacterized protein n=1 Tax=Panulirus ornatus TaxID=150431 RepID=UPI003A8994B5